MWESVVLATMLMSLGQARGLYKYTKCIHILNSAPDTIMETLEIPMKCDSGVVKWRNPRGYLRLHALKLSGYALCVEETWNTWWGSLRVVSGYKHRPISIPLPDKPCCVHDHGGQAVMIIQAQPILSESIKFRYKILRSNLF